MFSVSTKSQYGLRAMVRLAHSEEGTLSVAEIAAQEGISAKYLEGIVALLKAAELVQSQRGKCGGYALTRPPADISVLEIVRALEGDLSLVACVEKASCCSKSGSCVSRKFWNGLKLVIDGYLRDQSLADIVGDLGAKERV
jgi:Rrf2 family transcriptional regulator, iron-sulfur cluster assembly transcription factor